MSKTDKSPSASGSHEPSVAQDPAQAMWQSLSNLFPGLLPELKPALVPAKTMAPGKLRRRS